jgi:hypothetical protein
MIRDTSRGAGNAQTIDMLNSFRLGVPEELKLDPCIVRHTTRMISEKGKWSIKCASLSGRGSASRCTASPGIAQGLARQRGAAVI